MDSNAFLSCATLTASVSLVPAATLIICLVIELLPTDTAPAVEIQVCTATSGMVSGAKAPSAPFPMLATEPTPIATPPTASAFTVAPFPIATASSASTVLLFPKEITFSRPSNVLLSPITRELDTFVNVFLEPAVNTPVEIFPSTVFSKVFP